MKSRIHMSINLFDAVVFCVATLKRLTCIAGYVWHGLGFHSSFFFLICPNVSLQEKALSRSPPSQRVS